MNFLARRDCEFKNKTREKVQNEIFCLIISQMQFTFLSVIFIPKIKFLFFQLMSETFFLVIHNDVHVILQVLSDFNKILEKIEENMRNCFKEL